MSIGPYGSTDRRYNMKTLYLGCAMGAAGDMLTAALLELHPDPADFVTRLNALGIPGVAFRAEPSVKCGIRGTHMRVLVRGQEEAAGTSAFSADSPVGSRCTSRTAVPGATSDAFGPLRQLATGDAPYEHGHSHEQHPHEHEHPHEHRHSDLHSIAHLVRDHLELPEAVREDVMAVYGLIAAAESKVHGVPVEEIHFHEVGALDAVADVTAVCLLMWELAPERVLASPVHVGSGQVRCAHGLMPVPAPATAELLKNVPIYGGALRGELCTPTGAALLKYYVNSFGPMPPMRVSAVGYGMGTKDFPAANCVRALLGETEDAADGRPLSAPAAENGSDLVLELACNLDDMTGEAVGFAVERLFEAGALDVWTQAIGMKKSRPGILLNVLCKPSNREAITTLLFRHTTTLGVRVCVKQRAVLERRIETRETAFGPVRVKAASGCGVERVKYEYEDLARIAKEQGVSLDAARELVRRYFGQNI